MTEQKDAICQKLEDGNDDLDLEGTEDYATPLRLAADAAWLCSTCQYATNSIVAKKHSCTEPRLAFKCLMCKADNQTDKYQCSHPRAAAWSGSCDQLVKFTGRCTMKDLEFMRTNCATLRMGTRLNREELKPFMARKLMCQILQGMGPKKFHKTEGIDYSEHINMTSDNARPFKEAIQMALREVRNSGNDPTAFDKITLALK